MAPVTEAVLSPESARALELPALLALVAELAATDAGKERVLRLSPAARADALEARRRRYEEAASLLEAGQLVPAFEEPLAPLLTLLGEARFAVGGADLLRLASLLRATRQAAGRIGAAVADHPALAALAAELPDLAALERRIGATLDRRGEVRDEASPELTRLRREVRRIRAGIYEELGGLVARHREHLAEETIPLRGGRLMLVLRAGAHGRVGGLTHGRSATGKSFYFEPLEVVESNNRLQRAIEDEDAERGRLLAELVGAARESLPAIERHLEFLAELDLVQASHRFARAAEARAPEPAARHALRLAAARHPLLDPRLAELRGRALGQRGHAGAIVPLEVELARDRRALVVTGPNAGGKTVALKTVGLLAAAAQCGLPIPAAAGSRLPVFRRIVATVGDEQDLLADRSTFSGRLLRLQEAWLAAGPDALVLLDELGSGTDPEEGAALAVALLEGLLAKEALALVTTHLTQLAAAAMERAGAACAAMEFDPATGEPTFRLVAGPPGSSEALSLGRRLGLPPQWLDRAEALLGREHRDLRQLLAEVQAIRGELLGARTEAERAARALAEERERLETERDALEAERREVGRRTKRELETFRREVREKLGAEVERLRDAWRAGRRRGLAEEATGRLLAAAPALDEVPGEPVGPLRVGGAVRHRMLGWEGTLERLGPDRAEVAVRGKRVRSSPADLVSLGGEAAAATRETPWPAAADEGTAVPAELNLIGRRVEPALEELDRYLDRALLASHREVRVIHGHGSGRLREAVRSHLRRHPAVSAQRPGTRDEGGNGATVVTLKGS